MNREKILAIVLAAGVSGMASAASAAVIAQYNFDSLSGSPANVVTDISGNSHDVTLTGTFSLSNADPFDVSGAESSDKSLVGNPTTSTTAMANPGTIDLSGGQFTMEGWAQAASHNNILMEITAGTGSTATDIYIRLSTNDSNNGDKAAFLVKGNGVTTATQYSSATLSTTGTGWNHIALTYDGTNAKLYVNGVLDSTLNKPGLVFQNSFLTGRVGYPLTGQIDDVLLANTAYALGDANTPNTIAYDYTHSFTSATVPEPASLSLLAVGGLLLLGRRKKA
jgi:hypothetical protein